jgi:hypothetical protein
MGWVINFLTNEVFITDKPKLFINNQYLVSDYKFGCILHSTKNIDRRMQKKIFWKVKKQLSMKLKPETIYQTFTQR